MQKTLTGLWGLNPRRVKWRVECPPKGDKGASRSLDDRAGTPEKESYFPSDDMTPSYMQQLFCLLDDYDMTTSKPMVPVQSREGGRSTGSDGASDEEEEADKDAEYVNYDK